MSKGARIALATVVGLVVLGAAGWWFLLRDTAPPPADLDALDATATPGTLADPSSPAGSWVVQPGPDVFVGYRIEELFAGETIKKTAVGRTPAVEGSLVVDEEGLVPEVSVVADLTELGSDQERRDEAVRNRGLQTAVFPDAEFGLTEPIRLGLPAPGEEVTVEASGDLTLHGRTQPVTVSVTARWDGPLIAVEGSAPVVLADYDIERIEMPLVTVDDVGTFEFQLAFVPAG